MILNIWYLIENLSSLLGLNRFGFSRLSLMIIVFFLSILNRCIYFTSIKSVQTILISKQSFQKLFEVIETGPVNLKMLFTFDLSCSLMGCKLNKCCSWFSTCLGWHLGKLFLNPFWCSRSDHFNYVDYFVFGDVVVETAEK